MGFLKIFEKLFKRKTEEVKPYIEKDTKCDKCEYGLMERSGNMILTSESLLYPHKCNNCGYEENYPICYPYQRLVPLEQLRETTSEEL